MICKNCGAQIPDDSRFCFECGSQIETEEIHDTDVAATEKTEEIYEVNEQRVEEETHAVSSKEAKKKTDKKGVKLIAAIVILSLLFAALAAGTIVSSIKDYDELMVMGETYMEEENYEKAVEKFIRATEKDPLQPSAEVMLIKSYLALDDVEKAAEAVKNADAKIVNVSGVNERAKLHDEIKMLAMDIAVDVPEYKDEFKEIIDSSITVGNVDTSLFPQINVHINHSGTTVAPDRATLIIKEDGERKPVTNVEIVDSNEVVISYVADEPSSDIREGRDISVTHLDGEYEIDADGSYKTPEMRDVEITLEQVDSTLYPTMRLYYRIEEPQSGNALSNFNADEFMLYEYDADGNVTPVEIKNVMQLENNAALNVEVVADASGSMSGEKEMKMKAAIKNFANSLQYEVGDQMSVMTFDSDVYKICGFTSDPDVVTDCVGGISVGGQTAFYDAIIAGANEVLLQSGARCLIVFTDGVDNASYNSAQDAVDYVKKYKLPVFIIGIGDSLDTGYLSDMAEQTGGFYKHISEIDDLESIYASIYDERKKLYMVEYDTNSVFAQDAERAVKFEVKKPGLYSGSTSDKYVPVIATEGETAVDIIDLQVELQQAADKEASTASNIVIDYSAVSEFEAEDEYVDYLEGIIAASGKPNDAGKNNIVEYIQYVITVLSKYQVESDKNEIILSGDTIKEPYELALSIEERFVSLLEENGISLNKDILMKICLDVTGLDMTEEITVIVKETFPNLMGAEDEVELLLGSNRKTIEFGIDEAVKLLSDGDTKITLLYSEVENKVDVEISSNDTVIDQADGYIGLGLPAEDAMATVLATYSGGSDNWGGQFNPSNKRIDFETKYSGQYTVLEQELNITDISSVAPAEKEAIYFLVSKGYMTTEGDKFRPDNNLIRYEFTEALVKMFFALDRGLETSFSDVEKGSYYYDIVASAEADMLVEGYEDGEFKGDNIISKQELLTICARTLVEMKGYTYPENVDEYLAFDDADRIGGWAKEYVALAVREGLIDADGTLAPRDAVPRSEAAEILHSLFMLLYETEPVESVATDDAEGTADKDAEQGKGNFLANVEWSLPLVLAIAAAAVLIAIVVLAIVIANARKKEKN